MVGAVWGGMHERLTSLPRRIVRFAKKNQRRQRAFRDKNDATAHHRRAPAEEKKNKKTVCLPKVGECPRLRGAV